MFAGTPPYASDSRPPAIAALVCVPVYTLINRFALIVQPDGWALWQAAVSIAEGQGYRYFSGEPIVTWPPLYPLYLAAWAAAGGGTTTMLAAANVTLLALQAALWTYCALRVWKDAAGNAAPGIAGVVATYLGLFVAFNQSSVGAHLLLNALLPLFMVAVWRVATVDPPPWRDTSAATLLGVLLVNTHHTGLVFVMAGALLVAAHAVARGWHRAYPAAVTIAVAPAVAWIAVRTLLDQWQSHLVAPGIATETPLDYARQYVRSVGDLLSSDIVEPPRLAFLAAAGLVFLLTFRSTGRTALYAAAAMIGLTSAALLTIFSTTYINGELDSRFVLHIPLTIVPLAILAAGGVQPRFGIALAAVPLAPLVFQTAMAIANPERQGVDEEELLRFGTRISTSHRAGPPVQTGSERLIAPPISHEMDERIRSMRGAPGPP